MYIETKFVITNIDIPSYKNITIFFRFLYAALFFCRILSISCFISKPALIKKNNNACFIKEKVYYIVLLKKAFHKDM